MKHYFKTHEWIEKADGDCFHMGVSQYACDQLGNIVFIEAQEDNKVFLEGQSLAILESVKAVGDVYSPCELILIKTNPEAISEPEKITGDTWIVEVVLKVDFKNLEVLTEEEYKISLLS